MRMERKFPEDWRMVTQMVTVKGKEVSCVEVLSRVDEELVWEALCRWHDMVKILDLMFVNIIPVHGR